MQKIIWISSYPKSGNTFLRSLIAAYFYCERGVYNQNSLAHLPEYPRDYFELEKGTNPIREFSKWEEVQKSISSNNRKFNFVKTHLANIKVNDIYGSINPLYTSCAIYIIRDPRNVLLSLIDHFQLSHKEAVKFFFEQTKILQTKKLDKSKGYTPILDWGSNYESWKKEEKIKKYFVKYEDLANHTEEIFIKILEYLQGFISFKINKEFVKNAVDSTSFDKLQTLEQTSGFIEKEIMGLSRNHNMFFKKGKNRNFEEELSTEIINEIEKKYYLIMKNFNYL